MCSIINFNVSVNDRGNNANIKAGLGVTDETMIANGFRQYNGRWNYIKDLGHDITLGIYILCDCVIIDVFDECFCQPYDYQYYLSKYPNSKIALEVHNQVQTVMKQLSDEGIIVGYTANDYI